MSTSLTEPLDPERWAASGKVLEGQMPVAGMPRLLAAMMGSEADEPTALMARCRFRFQRNEYGQLVLEGDVSLQLPLQCQRCLEPVWWPLQQTLTRVLVDSEREVDDLPVEQDPLLREQRLISLSTVVEEELLVSLPQVARHPQVEACGALARDDRLLLDEQAVSEVEEAPEAAPRQRPFKVLAGLKAGKGKPK